MVLTSTYHTRLQSPGAELPVRLNRSGRWLGWIIRTRIICMLGGRVSTSPTLSYGCSPMGFALWWFIGPLPFDSLHRLCRIVSSMLLLLVLRVTLRTLFIIPPIQADVSSCLVVTWRTARCRGLLCFWLGTQDRHAHFCVPTVGGERRKSWGRTWKCFGLIRWLPTGGSVFRLRSLRC